MQETVDAAASCRGRAAGRWRDRQRACAIRCSRPADLTAAAKGRLTAREVAAGLEAAGVADRAGGVDALLAEAAEHAERVALEKAGRRTLKGLGRPTYELPLLPEGVDLGGLYELAERLCRQGAA